MEVPGPSGVQRRRSRMYINPTAAHDATTEVETKPISGLPDTKDFVVDVTELSGTDTDSDSLDLKAKQSERKQSERKRIKVKSALESPKVRRVLAGIMAMWCIMFLLAFTLYIELTKAASTSLPAYPLAVKNPYLSAWMPSTYASDVTTAQPQFWTGTSDLTWTVLARVGTQTYTLFGAATSIADTISATQNAISYTSSHTLVNLTAANVNFTLDFFSPVLPASNDLARQSLPYSYLSVSAISNDGQPADVQILSAVDSSWTAQGSAPDLTYNQTTNSSYFQFFNPKQYLYSEVNDMATYGSIVFGTSNTPSTSYGCDTPANLYNSFTSNGALSASTSSKSAPVCTGSDLAGLAISLGSVSTTSAKATYAIGFDRSHAINYLGQAQTGYYRSQWPTIPQQLDFFLSNYTTMLANSTTFDAQVRSRAESVSNTFGSNYADILEASVRQAFAASEITIPLTNLSTEKPYVFLKEISSDGNVNTVDVIYPTFPIYLALNPLYLKMVLQPVLDYLEVPTSAGGWPKNFTIHDIGSHYPNATGHANGQEEDMPLFETSALMQLMLAYQKFSGDTAWATNYTSLLNSYAEYLVQNSLYPSTQLISVDAIAATANQTGLAVQSAIGLAAAGELLNNTAYTSTAATYVNAIYNKGLGLDTDSPSTASHFTYNYGESSSWGTLFPAYPDVLLNLTTFPTAAYEMEGNYLLSQNQPAGLPFFGPFGYTTGLVSGGCDWSITDWTFWTSAATSNEELIENVVNATKTFITNGQNTEPFGTKYTVEAPGTIGQWVGNRARSTVGANFALILLEQGTWAKLY